MVIASLDLMGGPAVVETRAEFHAKRDVSPDGLGAAHQIVGVAQLLNGHKIGDFGHPFRGDELRQENR